MMPIKRPKEWRRESVVALTCLLMAGLPAQAVSLTGTVVDAESGHTLPARVYLQDAAGRWHFVASADPAGNAVRYERRNWLNKDSVEKHTTISAHPFRADLEPGTYLLQVERGKEYWPSEQHLRLDRDPLEVKIPLQRWVNMARRGWYGGDTHVHRTVAELPNVMLAEDLNVALPLTYWVTRGGIPPTRGDKTTVDDSGQTLIEVDPTHVIYARNTEYEIFSIGGSRHTLGGLFFLNHKTPFPVGLPPLGPVVEQAREEGAVLDMDKHNWPWSLALVPIVKPDLFELANNHHWRTHFAFTNFAQPAPAYMGIGHGRQDEEAWTRYGFQAYYALLNSGFDLKPSAGTANGVHPVPLGFGRVYVHLPGGFTYPDWIEGLKQGRSFVTTGPMLVATVQGRPPGHRVALPETGRHRLKIAGLALSQYPLSAIEVVVNGEVVRRAAPDAEKVDEVRWRQEIDEVIELSGSSWVALRCWEPWPKGRVRFAHTAPWHFEIPGRPLRPKRQEADWLVETMERELERSRPVLPEAGRKEYEHALQVYRGIQARAAE